MQEFEMKHGLRFEEKLKNKKILVLVPHPDDDIIGMGGTLALLKNTEAEIDCICISSSGIPSPDGKYSAEERNALRCEEWHKVMDELNVHYEAINSIYGDVPPFVERLKKEMHRGGGLFRIFSQLDVSNYDFIFVPSFFEQHEEHRFLTYNVLPALLKKSKNQKQWIAMYEVWSLQSVVTDYSDISDFIGEKIRLLKLYESQLRYVDYDYRVEGLNRYRGHMGGGTKYAEAFMVLKKNHFRYVAKLLRLILNFRKITRKRTHC